MVQEENEEKVMSVEKPEEDKLQDEKKNPEAARDMDFFSIAAEPVKEA